MGVAISSLQERRSLSAHEFPNSAKLQSTAGGFGPQNRCKNEHSTFVFLEASEDSVTTVSEAVSLLSLDELKSVAKELKIRGKTKAGLQSELVDMSMRQSTLSFTNPRNGNNLQEPRHGDVNKRQSGLQENGLSDLERRLILKAKDITGPCVRVSSITFQLFERVHLVFYRTREWTERSLTTIILAKISKQNFAAYVVSRTGNIFQSRQQLLEFEGALQLEHEIDELMASSTPPTADIFNKVVLYFDQISDRWRQGLDDEQKPVGQYQQSQDGGYLGRFCSMHVFTRIAHKAAYALGRLHSYSKEHALLTELLHQRLFHIARRGSWYQRRALLEEQYMSTVHSGAEIGSLPEQRKSWYRKAVATCEQALQDPNCHLIYHHDLRKRLVKLEIRLRIPRRLQHDFSHFQLLAPERHVFEGTQIKPGGGVLGNASRNRNRKTVWLDESGEGLECTVETMCLNRYRKQGWKGLHSEGGIIRTLYAYLFFDIFFLHVPNVFQTAYQTYPLDLFTDGFYAARASEINLRLVQIANGGAEKIVTSIYTSQVKRHPCVLGLNWEFQLEDVAEVARCFNGNALAAVCKVLSEDYRQRTGGLPDLLLWRMEPQPEVMFAEVKSTNDRLSDTQRLWIHVLLEAGAKVAVCNAVAKEVWFS